MKVDIDNLFPSAFDSDFKDVLNHNYTEFTEAGGRGSCKSSFISICIILLIVMNKGFNALVLRKTAKSLRNSVFEQIRWAVDKLELSHLFRFTVSPMQAVYTPTNQVILFSGVDDPTRLKSLKVKSGYFAVTWFEESAEFSSEETENVKLTTMRGGDKFYIFDSFNPPSSARNWKNSDIRIPKPNRLVHISSYLTTPKNWLGEAFIQEAEEMKLRNERAYRNIFLGEPTGTGANIFENLELRKITEEEIDSFEWLYYGIDFGYFPDPFIWNEFSYDSKTKTLYIIDELKLHKHRNEEASQKLEEHLRNKWEAKAKRLNKPKLADYDFKNDRIIADSAEPKSIADWAFYGWNIFGCQKFPHSLEAGMKWLQGINKIVIDPERAPEAADEFSLYEYALDKKSGEILEGFPDGQPDHAIAAARYGLQDIWQRKGM